MSETSLVPVQRRIIAWEGGVPVLTAEPVLTKQHVQSLFFITAAQPYEVTDPLDPDFGKYDGMTVAEVLVRKQFESAAKSGDAGQIENIWDRLIGKALSRGENVNVHASYEDFLKGIEAKAKSAAPSSPIVDAQLVVEPSSIFGDLAP